MLSAEPQNTIDKLRESKQQAQCQYWQRTGVKEAKISAWVEARTPQDCLKPILFRESSPSSSTTSFLPREGRLVAPVTKANLGETFFGASMSEADSENTPFEEFVRVYHECFESPQAFAFFDALLWCRRLLSLILAAILSKLTLMCWIKSDALRIDISAAFGKPPPSITASQFRSDLSP